MTDIAVRSLEALDTRLAEMANAQFDSPQYKKIPSLSLTQERAQVYILRRSFFHLNRVGRTEDDFANTPLLDGTMACRATPWRLSPIPTKPGHAVGTGRRPLYPVRRRECQSVCDPEFV